jgi:hypothetical protein
MFPARSALRTIGMPLALGCIMTKPRPFALLCLLALLSFPLMTACEKTVVGEGEIGKDGGDPQPEDAAVAPYNACAVADDCSWGEIPHEISRREDCVCRYGCPYLPLSKATVDRRFEQHKRYCDPHKDGDGTPCGIDDCVSLGALACSAGTCVAAP